MIYLKILYLLKCRRLVITSNGNRKPNHPVYKLNRFLCFCRWSPTPCMEQHYFICQHRMPVVKKDNLQHIYNMWNSTFPNQIANEIEVIFTNKDGDLRQRFQVEPEVGQPRQRGWRRPYPLDRNRPEDPASRVQPSETRRNSINSEKEGPRSRQWKRNEKDCHNHQERKQAKEERMAAKGVKRRHKQESKFIE